MNDQRPFSDISYEQFLNEERLMGSRCRKCSAVFVPPRPICTKCSDADMEWVEMKGAGTLAAFTCIAVGLPFLKEEGYGRANPYCSGVVSLEEGGKVDAIIEGVNTREPETIKVGIPLRVKYLHRTSEGREKTYLAFEKVK